MPTLRGPAFWVTVKAAHTPPEAETPVSSASGLCLPLCPPPSVYISLLSRSLFLSLSLSPTCLTGLLPSFESLVHFWNVSDAVRKAKTEMLDASLSDPDPGCSYLLRPSAQTRVNDLLRFSESCPSQETTSWFCHTSVLVP